MLKSCLARGMGVEIGVRLPMMMPMPVMSRKRHGSRNVRRREAERKLFLSHASQEAWE